MAVGYWFGSPSARPNFFAAYGCAFRVDLAKICAANPHDDLAIQWGACQEVLAWEGYFPNRPESYKEDIIGFLARLGNAVPEPGELGYHLCYGTPNDEHVVMPTDLANTVEIAHGIVARLERSLQYPRPGAQAPRRRRLLRAARRASPARGLRSLPRCHGPRRPRRRPAPHRHRRRPFPISASRPRAAGAAATRLAPQVSSTATELRWREGDRRTWPSDSREMASGFPGVVQCVAAAPVRVPPHPRLGWKPAVPRLGSRLDAEHESSARRARPFTWKELSPDADSRPDGRDGAGVGC